jgi:hypothetical protein
MFVASLNLDLFFKKVFSNKLIAKKFLEDLLGVTITEIKLLAVENKLTDAAVVVKFDFRCKIHGQYAVIEMQQHYKIDVIKRFCLYHSVSMVLQLERLKPIIVTKPNGETYTEKNYSGLKPVVTVIWMVDDTLGFEEDFSHFKNEKEMVEVINRLRKDKLTPEEFKYVSDLDSYEIFLVRKEEEHKQKMAQQKKRLEKIAFEYQLKAEQDKQKAEQDKQKTEQDKQKADSLLLKSIKMLLQQGETIPTIADALEISIGEVTILVEQIQNN